MRGIHFADCGDGKPIQGGVSALDRTWDGCFNRRLAMCNDFGALVVVGCWSRPTIGCNLGTDFWGLFRMDRNHPRQVACLRVVRLVWSLKWTSRRGILVGVLM